VNGFPTLLSLPNVSSGYETPIYETASLCSFTPEMTPSQPANPIFIHALPYLLFAVF